MKASTVALRKNQIRQLASAAVTSGLAIADLTSLEVLVRPVNAKAALRVLLNRRGGARGVHLASQAQLLATIARHWVKADEADIRSLQAFASGLKVKSGGMKARNKERLRQFDLPANLRALLTLPQKVLKDAQRQDDGGEKMARRVMLAAAVELLIMAPMRVGNLAGLQIGRHLVKTRRGGREVMHISIPGHETKNGLDIDLALPSETCGILDTYVRHHRPRLCRVPSHYLFPGGADRVRNEVALSRAISDFILKETGIVMHVHLFRHLAGKLHLEAHPEEVETVRLVLGHRSTTTTLQSYAQTRADQAFRNYDSTIARLRDGASPRGDDQPRGR